MDPKEHPNSGGRNYGNDFHAVVNNDFHASVNDDPFAELENGLLEAPPTQRASISTEDFADTSIVFPDGQQVDVRISGAAFVSIELPVRPEPIIVNQTLNVNCTITPIVSEPRSNAGAMVPYITRGLITVH